MMPVSKPTARLGADGKMDEEEEEKKIEKSKGSGGFFSMITNFFSSKGTTQEAGAKQSSDKDSVLRGTKDDFKEMHTGRKASKSMQVVQPNFMNFQKQIDINDVAKIKTLSSGLTILKALHDKGAGGDLSQVVTLHRKQKSSIDRIPHFGRVERNFGGASGACHHLLQPRNLHPHSVIEGQQIQPLPHMRQETATFVIN